MLQFKLDIKRRLISRRSSSIHPDPPAVPGRKQARLSDPIAAVHSSGERPYSMGLDWTLHRTYGFHASRRLCARRCLMPISRSNSPAYRMVRIHVVLQDIEQEVVEAARCPHEQCQQDGKL